MQLFYYFISSSDMIEFLKNNKARFFNVSIFIWAAIIPSLINILLNPFLANALSAKDFAIIGYYTSFNLVVLPFVTFSFINYYSKIYFDRTPAERTLIRDTLLSTSLIVGPVLTVLAILAFMLFANFSAVSLPLFPYLVLSFAVNLFGYYFLFYQTELKMQGDAKKYFSISLVNTLVFAVFTVLLVIIFPFGATGKFASLLIANIFMAIFCVKKMLTRFRINKQVLRDFFQFSWPIFFSSLLFYALSSIDRIFLEKINDDYQFGLYNIAFQIITYISIVNIAVLQTFTPDLFKSTANRDFSKLFKISFAIIISAVVLNLAFIPIAKLVISILTYGKFTDAYIYAQILAVRNICYIIFFVFSDILIGLGLTKFEMVIRIFGAVISVMIYSFLIQKYGFIGASWAQSVVLLIPILLGAVTLKFFKTRIL